MNEKELIEQLFGASPYMATAIVALVLIVRASNIVGAVKGLVETWNDGSRERSEAMASVQTQAIKASTEAIEKAMNAMSQAMLETSKYHIQRLDDMRLGMTTLERRVDEVEEDNAKLREENQKLRDELKERDQKVRDLEKEIETLRQRLDRRLKKEATNEAKTPAVPGPLPAGV